MKGQQEQHELIMLPTKILNIRAFSDLISQASSALRLSEKQIREKFSEYPICFMDFYENNERQKSVEIRFDEEKTSISCIFDANDRCDYAFIVPDQVNTLIEYVNFFNAVYDFDSIRHRWILSNDYISQRLLQEGICFMVNY